MRNYSCLHCFSLANSSLTLSIHNLCTFFGDLYTFCHACLHNTCKPFRISLRRKARLTNTVLTLGTVYCGRHDECKEYPEKCFDINVGTMIAKQLEESHMIDIINFVYDI